MLLCGQQAISQFTNFPRLCYKCNTVCNTGYTSANIRWCWKMLNWVFIQTNTVERTILNDVVIVWTTNKTSLRFMHQKQEHKIVILSLKEYCADLIWSLWFWLCHSFVGSFKHVRRVSVLNYKTHVILLSYFKKFEQFNELKYIQCQANQHIFLPFWNFIAYWLSFTTSHGRFPRISDWFWN